MEAPAPASALIHSATLVSAGIFIVLRLSPFFELSTCGQFVIPVVGAITSFYGGIVSSAQTDLKKILAYSTISHCGFMMLLASTHNVDLTLLYLYIHGFFKALLFLAAGNIMRLFKCQDFRYMGGAYKYLPLECVICIFSFWHLSGGPFSYGYIAKHYIITSVVGNNLTSVFIYANLLMSILASIIYSYRFIYFVFFDFKKGKKPIYNAYSSPQLSSLSFSISTRAGILIIFISYIFILLTSSYVVSL
jgi:NADH-quinone oxidoreductase subunit L